MIMSYDTNAEVSPMRFTPQTIVPSEFQYLDSYDLGNAEDQPFNVGPCAKELEALPVENFESMSKCCVCGTPFRHGDVWRHTPTNLRIVIGHRCAAKYGLMAGRGQYKNMRAAEIKKRERIAERYRVRSEMRKFLRGTPGLAEQLHFGHHIIKNMRASFIRWGSLSDPQMMLIDKIIRETKAHRQAEVDLGPSIPVVTGRHELTGTILALSWKPNNFSHYSADILKMTVRVDGWYKVWGTCPDALSDLIWEQSQKDEEFNGGIVQWVQKHPVRVKFTATVAKSDKDESFGFFKRPTKAEVLS